jgi:hypothetical protein
MAKTLVWKLEVDSNGRVRIEMVDVLPSVGVGGVGVSRWLVWREMRCLSLQDWGRPWGALGLGQIDRAEVG